MSSLYFNLNKCDGLAISAGKKENKNMQKELFEYLVVAILRKDWNLPKWHSLYTDKRWWAISDYENIHKCTTVKKI